MRTMFHASFTLKGVGTGEKAGIGQIFRGDHSYIVCIFNSYFEARQIRMLHRLMTWSRDILRKPYCLISTQRGYEHSPILFFETF